ncbi:MAG TPA: IS200/IS605 family transposase [Gammaproteobacteria bacterium]|nr:IS200/IS605 family transposase [Gammaproteobacteria bacterium]
MRAGRHVVFSLYAHLVFVSKYRKKIFNKQMLDLLSQTFSDTCKKFDAELVEFEGESDHVHLLINYPPKVALSKLVNSLKGVSSRLLRITFKQHIAKYYWKNVFWSPSYFVGSCGGAPLNVIKQYIQNQQVPYT